MGLRLRLPAGADVEHVLRVQAEGLGGDDWTQAPPSQPAHDSARSRHCPYTATMPAWTKSSAAFDE